MNRKITKIIAVIMAAVTVMCIAPVIGLSLNFEASAASSEQCIPETVYLEDKNADCSELSCDFINKCVENNPFVKCLARIFGFIKKVIDIVNSSKDDLKQVVGQHRENTFTPPINTHELYYLTDEMVRRMLEEGASIEDIIEYLRNQF